MLNNSVLMLVVLLNARYKSSMVHWKCGRDSRRIMENEDASCLLPSRDSRLVKEVGYFPPELMALRVFACECEAAPFGPRAYSARHDENSRGPTLSCLTL